MILKFENKWKAMTMTSAPAGRADLTLIRHWNHGHIQSLLYLRAKLTVMLKLKI